MGGHSHWSTIRRHKASIDAKRGRIFTKIIREITAAARVGGGDPEGNPRLRTAVAKAKEANLPQDTLKKALQRGTGELPGVHYEEITYEGYGPGGVALLLEVMTDNRNRTVSDIRHIMGKYGGNLGETGCVAWMFQRKGYLEVERSCVEEEKLLDIVLEAGAEDLKAGEKSFEVTTAPDELETVRQALEGKGIPTLTAELTMLPQNTIPLEEKEAVRMLRLLDALDDQDDVQKIFANFDIAEEIIQKVAAG